MRTANDSIDPRSIRGDIDHAKSAIAAMATAEKEVLKAKAEKLTALHRAARQFAEEENARFDACAQVVHDEFHAASARAQARAEARAGWIQQAYHASKTSLARRIQEQKDRRIGSVHGDILLRRQARQREFDVAAALHSDFQQQLADNRATRLEIRARVLLSCRSFKPVIASWFRGRNSAYPEVEKHSTPEQTRSALLEALDLAQDAADAAARLPLAAFFRHVPLWVLAVVILAIHLWLAFRSGGEGLVGVLPSLVLSVAALLGLWGLAFVLSIRVLKRVASSLAAAEKHEARTLELSADRLAEMEHSIRRSEAEEKQSLSEVFQESGEEWRHRISEGHKKLDARHAAIPAKQERIFQKRLAALDASRDAALSAIRAESGSLQAAFAEKQAGERAVIDAQTRADIDKLIAVWNADAALSFARLAALDHISRAVFPEWTEAVCADWEPPAEAPSAIRIGSVEVDAARLTGGLPAGGQFSLTEHGRVHTPFALSFPYDGSLLIETDGPDDGTASRALHAVALRLIASHPPGRASFLFIDPVGLGKDFSGLMHLADYEESLITSRIWTQSTHIEERLSEIKEHIEKVIQMYLRDEYPDIRAYNEQADTITEKSRFIVIAGFPAGFSDTAAKRLRSIASSGARCGVHLLIQRDVRQEMPDASLAEDLRRVCQRVTLRHGAFHLEGAPQGADKVVFDAPPSMQDSVTLVHRIGRASVDSNRVQVPFAHVAPPPGEEWSLDTGDELRVPVGRTGAKKLQMLAIGKGTRQHALIAGKTGSGKSTLFHVIISNLARWASPDQVEFYLVDFKKGVEFKCYAEKKLPHARVVAIESDREFALSVLQRVDAELRRRGELFRKAGSQDLPGYRRTPGAPPMPRTLLLIDEFQEFFTEDDAVAQEASLLLDRVVRQGRAFGIHVILGSQTLGGAYTLARATLGQMVIRIALQCNEADAHLIMDDDNPAPRLLTRPGEGIYNDQAGAVAANSPFQIVWLPEVERDQVLDEAAARERELGGAIRTPIVFEGNAPAEVRDNPEFGKLLRERPAARPKKAHAWLGAPNSIKGPTEAVFQRQSGSHLLVVGQSAERSLALLSLSVAALALQYPPGEAEFVILDPHASETEGWYHRLAAVLPNRVRVGGPAELPELMNSLAAELAARAPVSGKSAPEMFLVVQDIQRFKVLRGEDEFRFSLDDDEGGTAAKPSKVLADLLGEGGSCGMHVIASADSWNNVSRWIARKLMAEFEMRVLFQMGANDSANLIDSPAASTLGLHRALFHNENLGTVETFRPYALPDAGWLEEIKAALPTR